MVTVKIVFLSAICGITLATSGQPYSENSTLLTGEIKNGGSSRLSDKVSKLIASIQIDNKRICSAVASDYFIHNAVVTTAVCARQIKAIIHKEKINPYGKCIKVCCEGLTDTLDKCSSIDGVGISRQYKKSVRDSYNPQNSGLIILRQIIHSEGAKERHMLNTVFKVGEEIVMVGFEFKEKECEIETTRYIREIRAHMVDSNKCAAMFNIPDWDFNGYLREWACFRAIDEDATLEIVNSERH